MHFFGLIEFNDKGDHKKVVEACTAGYIFIFVVPQLFFDVTFGVALSDDPNYIKVLHRRAISNEALGTWSSLTSAEQGATFALFSSPSPYAKGCADYTNLLNILPEHSSMILEIQNATRKLKPRKEAAQSAEMGEMMDKLKGVGNSLLGKFVKRILCFPLRLTYFRKFWIIDR